MTNRQTDAFDFFKELMAMTHTVRPDKDASIPSNGSAMALSAFALVFRELQVCMSLNNGRAGPALLV